jgi:hypothetical protein
MTARPDLEALLVALVLLPGTYSRNRFFDLYTDPAAKEVRRRAGLVRSIVTEVTSGDTARRGRIVGVAEAPDGQVEFSYVVAALNLKRTTTLSPLEISLVRYALARRTWPFEPLPADDPDRERIERVLGRLGPALPDAANDGSREDELPSA